MRVLLALIFVAGVAQAESPSDCSVDGIAVNSVTGAPVARAYIIVNVTNGDEKASTDSDQAGKWKIEHAPCGRVSVYAAKTGYMLQTTSGARPKTATLKAGIPLHDLRAEMVPQTAIFGRVVDEQGEPIQGVDIRLYSSHVIEGARRIEAGDTRSTDDQGSYRLSGLRPGHYFVCAEGHLGLPGGTTVRPYAGVCYPGPASPSASGVAITAGEEQRVDLTLPPADFVSINGKLIGSAKGVMVGVLPPGRGWFRMPNHITPVRADNTFTLTDVSPGSYDLVAGTTAEEMWAITPIGVGKNGLSDVVLRMESGVALAVGFRYLDLGTDKVMAREPPLLKLNSATGGERQPEYGDGGQTAVFRNLPEGRYSLGVDQRDLPWYVKSAKLGTQDILGAEFDVGPATGEIEVTLANDAGTIEGNVSDKDGLIRGQVLLLGENDRVTFAYSNEGHFRAAALRPGDYSVSAWDSLDGVEYRNPDWMKKNAKAKTVTVGSSATANIDLDLQFAPEE